MSASFTPTHRIQQMLAVFRREVRRVNDQRELLLRAADPEGGRMTAERIYGVALAVFISSEQA